MSGLPLPRNIQKGWRRATLHPDLIDGYVNKFCPHQLRGEIIETRAWEARRPGMYGLRRLDVLFADGRMFSLRLRATGEARAHVKIGCCA